MFQLNTQNHPPGFTRARIRLAILPLYVLAAQAQADGIWDNCVRSTGNNPLYYHWYPRIPPRPSIWETMPLSAT